MSASDAGGIGLGAKVGAAVLVLLAAGGGAAFVLDVGPFASPDTAPIDQVPAGADVVFYVDGDVRDDPATKALVNETLSSRDDDQYYTGPGSYEEMMNQTRGNTSLDPSKMEEVLSYGKYPPKGAGPDAPTYWGVIIHAGWSAEDVTSELENKSTTRTWEESSYNGHTVYKSEPAEDYRDPAWFAVLGDGEYVVGNPDAVRDAIDVAEGETDALGGDLRSEYDKLPDDALVTFAMDVPRDRIPEETVEQSAKTSPVDYSVFTSVDMVSGAYHTSSNSLGVTINLRATDENAAKDMADVTKGAKSFASGTVSNETVEEGLRDIEVSRDGATVSVSYEKSVSHVRQLLAALDRLGM